MCDDLAKVEAKDGKDGASEAAAAESRASGSSAFFQAGGMSFAVRLVDAQFPPYAQVIPAQSEKNRARAAERIRGCVAGGVRRSEWKAYRRGETVADQGDDANFHGVAGKRRGFRRSRGGVFGRKHDLIGFNAKYFLPDVLGALWRGRGSIGAPGRTRSGRAPSCGGATVSRCGHADAYLMGSVRPLAIESLSVRGFPQPEPCGLGTWSTPSTCSGVTTDRARRTCSRPCTSRCHRRGAFERINSRNSSRRVEK